MNLIQKTILICSLIIPVFVYANSLREEAHVEQAQIDIVLTEEQPKEIVKDYSIESLQKYAQDKVTEKWGHEQASAFNYIIQKESSWKVNTNHYKQNIPIYDENGNIKGYKRLSSAYGLGGFLDATWDDVGCKKTSDQYIQIDCTIKYISARYGTPIKAMQFHKTKGSY